MPKHQSGLVMRKVTVRREGKVFVQNRQVRASKPARAQPREHLGAARFTLGQVAQAGIAFAAPHVLAGLGHHAGKALGNRFYIGGHAKGSENSRTLGSNFGGIAGHALGSVGGVFAGRAVRNKIHGNRKMDADMQVKRAFVTGVTAITNLTGMAENAHVSSQVAGQASRAARHSIGSWLHGRQQARASTERARNNPTFRLEATNKRQGPTARTSGNRIYF